MTRRQRIHAKYGGRCAYCGNTITLRQMHVDHAAPVFRDWGTTHPIPAHAGEDTESNMLPACRPCNLRKSTLSLESFRAEIAAQVGRLRRDSAAFRMAERFGQVVATEVPVKFWFEAEEKRLSELPVEETSRCETIPRDCQEKIAEVVDSFLDSAYIEINLGSDGG